MRLSLLFVAAAIGAAAPHVAAGQSAADLLQQGVRAFGRADYEAAVALFRRTLDAAPRDSAGATVRRQTLDYLGASYFFTNRRDSASAVFLRVLQDAPRHRLDDVVFPPAVASFVDEMQRNTKIVTVTTPVDTAVALQGGRWPIRLITSSFHDVSVVLVSTTGAVVRTLYAGPLGDSLSFAWDARDAAGAPAGAGAYVLRVQSIVGGRTVRTINVPVTVGRTPLDTVPLPQAPPASLILVERTPGGPAMRSLLAGVGLGTLTAILPSVVAGGATPSSARVAIGGAIGLAGAIGFYVHRGGRPIEANIAANRVRREAWADQVRIVEAENEARRSGVRVTIRTGAASVAGTGAP